MENNDTVSNTLGIHNACFACVLVLQSLIWKQHGRSSLVISCVPICIVILGTGSTLLMMEKYCKTDTHTIKLHLASMDYVVAY